MTKTIRKTYTRFPWLRTNEAARLALLSVGVALSFSAHAAEFAQKFLTEEDPDTFRAHCSEALRAQGVVCIRAKNVTPDDKRRPAWSDIQATKEFRAAVSQYGEQAVVTEGKGLPIFVVAYRRKERGWQNWIFSAHLAGSWPQATDTQKKSLQESLMKLKAWPEGSDQHSELLGAHFVRENEQQAAAERVRTEALAAKRPSRQRSDGAKRLNLKLRGPGHSRPALRSR
jgi:hypothetical protein